MTPLRYAEARMAVRDPDARRRPAGDDGGFPTPFPMATKAVRLHHTAGAEAARRYLADTIEASPYWGPNSPHRAPQSWAATIQTCLATYITLADSDPRPTLDTPISTTVEIDGLPLAVTIDVVLLGDGGYTARLPLWDKAELDDEIAALYATPLILALEQELGTERSLGVEIWHLRSGSSFIVPRAAALAHQADVAQALHRFIA